MAENVEKTYLQNQIESRMKAMGLSMRALSEKVGGNDSLVKAIISGKSKNPRSDTLGGIARALRCSVADLTGEAAVDAPGAELGQGAPSDIDVLYHVIVRVEYWLQEDDNDLDPTPEQKARLMLAFYDAAKDSRKPPEQFNPRDYPNVVRLSQNL